MPHNDPSLLRAALVGYTQELHRIEQAMSDIRARLGQKKTPSAAPAKKRTLSKEASKRISAAQKKRWEAYRTQKAAQA